MTVDQRILRAIALIVALGAAPADLAAHAIIVESVPSMNATLNGGDHLIRLRFNSRIDHQRSSLTLVPAGGAARDGGPRPAATSPDEEAIDAEFEVKE